jgi:hypothetical protein
VVFGSIFFHFLAAFGLPLQKALAGFLGVHAATLVILVGRGDAPDVAALESITLAARTSRAVKRNGQVVARAALDGPLRRSLSGLMLAALVVSGLFCLAPWLRLARSWIGDVTDATTYREASHAIRWLPAEEAVWVELVIAGEGHNEGMAALGQFAPRWRGEVVAVAVACPSPY